MKFNLITYFPTENIFDECDFENSIYYELCNEFQTKWDKILFSFEEFNEDIDVFHNLILELEGISLCRDISEELKIYNIDELIYCVIEKDDGTKGLCIKFDDLQEFKNIIEEYGI